MRLIGHGIDIVDVARIGRLIEQHGERFLERCYTQHERDQGPGTRPYAQRLAARFAAKEAALKALGTGLSDGIHWVEIEVRTHASGKPLLHLSGRALEIAKSLGVTSQQVSLTHTRQFAAASVVLLGD